MAVKKSVKKTVKKKNTKNVVKANASRANKLTGKERDFCYSYIANRFNGTRAARDAGYKGADNVLGAIANENLKKPKIRKLVNKLTNEYLADKKKLGRDVIAELATLGFRRIPDVVQKDSRGRILIKEFEDMNGAEAAINKIEVNQVDLTTGGEITEDTDLMKTETKIWLEGKTKPLEILAKHSGQIVEKTEQSINFPNGEFANTREIDLSKVPTDKLKKIQADLKAMEDIIPELKGKK